MNLGSDWIPLAAILSTAALLAALLIGLRPVPPDEAEAAAEQAPDATPAIGASGRPELR